MNGVHHGANTPLSERAENQPTERGSGQALAATPPVSESGGWDQEIAMQEIEKRNRAITALIDQNTEKAIRLAKRGVDYHSGAAPDSGDPAESNGVEDEQEPPA